MKEPKSEQPARELPPDRAWKSKDYGIGPEPEWGTLEWENWIEMRALLAAAAEIKEARGRVTPALSIPGLTTN
jgi:hypothetical protein